MRNTKKRSRNPWEDHYTRLARKEKYPARSVYKLSEIQKKYRLIRPGDRVLDLGCAPGSWLLFASEQVGPGGQVIGIDKEPVTALLPANVRTHTADILAEDFDPSALLSGPFDVVLSDMAPATSGRKEVDAARSFRLCMAALGIAAQRLRPGGRFCCKIFTGEEFASFLEEVRRLFESCRIFKPKSSRKASKETYIIATGRQQEDDDYVGSQQMVDDQA